MKVIEINEGSKIPYEVSKTKICFDDDLTINLAKRQEDWPVHIDILTDGDGVLVTGAESGNYYVAQIDIPAREYKKPEATEETATVEEGGEQAGRSAAGAVTAGYGKGYAHTLGVGKLRGIRRKRDNE